MKAVIELENLEFWGYHGCYDVEHKVGNQYRVDLELGYDAEKAVASDDISQALNYQEVYRIVSQVMADEKHLLESVCALMLESLFEQIDCLEYAWVKIAKLNPPLGGKIGATSVSMRKDR